MQISLNKNSNTKTLAVLSIITALFAAVTALVSDFILPIPAALFAIIILLENGKKKYFSVSLGVLMLALNVISVLFFGSFMFSCLEIIILGFIIAICFSKDLPKGETVFIICVAATLFIILNAVSLAIVYTRIFSFDAIKVFYSELYGSVKTAFVESVSTLTSSLPEGSADIAITPDEISALLDSMIPMIISFIVICGFIITGFTLKIFSFVAFRLDSEKKEILDWRFRTGSLFAYFYLALLILQLFTANSTDLFAVIVANLTNIFCAVYAYIGFNFVYMFLSMKRSPVFSFILLIAGVVLFSTIVIDIFAITGAFVTITSNKAIAKK